MHLYSWREPSAVRSGRAACICTHGESQVRLGVDVFASLLMDRARYGYQWTCVHLYSWRDPGTVSSGHACICTYGESQVRLAVDVGESAY